MEPVISFEFDARCLPLDKAPLDGVVKQT